MRTCWRSASQADPVIPENEFAQLQEVVDWILENGGVPYIAHTYWSGLRTEQWEACEGLLGLEVWNAGCELEIGRGDSSIHWDEALERGRGSATRSRPTTRIIPATTAASRGRGCAPPRRRRRRCSTRCAPAPSTARPGRRSTSVEVTRRRRHRAVQPGAERHALLRPRPRRARERGPARLSERRAGARARRRRPDHRRPARAPVAPAVRARRGARRRRPPRLDEPAVDSDAAARAARRAPLRPARRRRRDHRRGHRRGRHRRTGWRSRSSTRATSPARRRARRRS